MRSSKKISGAKLLEQAIALKDRNTIIEALYTYKNKQTLVSMFYKYRNQMDTNDKEFIYNLLIKSLLPGRQLLTYNKVTKHITITEQVIKDILDNKNKSNIDLLIYQLLNTGRRLNELVNSEIELKEDNLYIKLSKGNGLLNVFCLDNRPIKAYQDINSLKNKFNMNSVSTQIARRLKEHSITAHSLRGIYVMLIYKFHNPENYIIDDIAHKYLGHQSNSSDKYYTQFIYNGPNPFKIDLNLLTCRSLRIMAKKQNKKRYSKLKKSELIELLSS